MKLFRIVTAYYLWFTNRNNKLAQERVLICRDCELFKWGVCTVCTCPVRIKATLEDEICPHPNGNKWRIKTPANRQQAGV